MFGSVCTPLSADQARGWRVYVWFRVYSVYFIQHRLNMKLDLQSLFRLHVPMQLYSLAETPQPLPPLLGSYTRALLVSQDRQHLFVTPCNLPPQNGPNKYYHLMLNFLACLVEKILIVTPGHQD